MRSPCLGVLSDRVGRKPLYLAGALLSAGLAFPVFWLLETRDPTVVVLTVVVIMSVTHGLMFGPQAAYLPELFGTRTRYSGASLGCQVSAALSGGFAPIIATGLLAWAGATWPVSLYLIGLAAITLLAVMASGETAELDIGRR
jgi:MHS family shikimate/dehydroshikimate transporter-like MFS transporter